MRVKYDTYSTNKQSGFAQQQFKTLAVALDVRKVSEEDIPPKT